MPNNLTRKKFGQNHFNVFGFAQFEIGLDFKAEKHPIKGLSPVKLINVIGKTQ